MPNQIDATGITIETSAEILSDILNGTANYSGLYSIYGPTINVNPNSPDGQMVNIVAQAKLDVLEAIVQAYNSFDPDQAVGVQLDQRCAINGVFRQAGSYTSQQIAVTTSAACTLVGLDAAPATPFTVQDGAGNQYAPVTTTVISSATVTTVVFQAILIGPIQSAANAITTIATVQAGVTSVNNPSGPTSVGTNEETDYALRIRRQNSVALPSIGYLSGLYGAIIDTLGVTAATIYENTTNATDANGVPAHSIWPIVLGGSNTDVANAIYLKRSAGCGMFGAVTQGVTQYDGSTFNVKFSRPTNQTLYLSFSIAAITGSVDVNYVRTKILSAITYGIGQTADVTAIVAYVKGIVPNAYITNEGVSPDNVTYTATLAPTTVDKQFILASTTIKINGAFGV